MIRIGQSLRWVVCSLLRPDPLDLPNRLDRNGIGDPGFAADSLNWPSEYVTESQRSLIRLNCSKLWKLLPFWGNVL